MSFSKRDHPAGLKRHDIDMHIMAQVLGVNKAGGGPFAIRIRHGNGGVLIIMGNETLRAVNTIRRLIAFSDPMERRVVLAKINQLPLDAGAK